MDHRPKTEGAPSERATDDRGTPVPPLSWGAFRHLVTDAADKLREQRVTAVLGSTVEQRHGGTLWISASSPHGNGRLVRNPDGSSHVQAHRSADGATLLDADRPQMRAADFDELIDALGDPRRVPTRLDRGEH